VPDRGHILEISVDDADGARALQRGPVDIALRDRRHVQRVQFLCRLGRRQCRPGEHDDSHTVSRMRDFALDPGTNFGE
jgi:hypothetical protein